MMAWIIFCFDWMEPESATDQTAETVIYLKQAAINFKTWWWKMKSWEKIQITKNPSAKSYGCYSDITDSDPRRKLLKCSLLWNENWVCLVCLFVLFKLSYLPLKQHFYVKHFATNINNKQYILTSILIFFFSSSQSKEDFSISISGHFLSLQVLSERILWVLVIYWLYNGSELVFSTGKAHRTLYLNNVCIFIYKTHSK